jgi:hypothetical protein
MLEELGCDVLQAHSGNDAPGKIVDDPSKLPHNALAAFAVNSMSSCYQEVRVTAADIR